MYLFTHAATGLLIGTVINNPIGAFAGGVVSHFLLDIIPHDHKDDLILEYPKNLAKNNTTVKRRIVLSLMDLFLVILVVIYGWYLSSEMESLRILINILCAVAGSTVPDFVLLFTFKYDNKFLRWYFEAHNKLHFIFPVSVPRVLSGIGQLNLTAVFLYFSYNLI